MLALITGGARSGKSSFAEQYAAGIADYGYYIATSQIWDEEMEQRIAAHRLDRDRSGFSWTTVEEPLALPEVLERLALELNSNGSGSGKHGGQPVVLVDCLTLWLSNLLLTLGLEEWNREEQQQAAAVAEQAVDRLIAALRLLPAPALLVTNEVGSGIVPAYPLGRLYRDLAGRMNRRLAALCDQTILVTAGIPVDLKQLAFRIPDRSAFSGGR